MTTAYSPADIAIESRDSKGERRGGLLRRIFESFIAAREREVRSRMSIALSSYTDEELNHYGISRDEILNRDNAKR